MESVNPGWISISHISISSSALRETTFVIWRLLLKHSSIIGLYMESLSESHSFHSEFHIASGVGFLQNRFRVLHPYYTLTEPCSTEWILVDGFHVSMMPSSSAIDLPYGADDNPKSACEANLRTIWLDPVLEILVNRCDVQWECPPNHKNQWFHSKGTDDQVIWRRLSISFWWWKPIWFGIASSLRSSGGVTYAYD